MRLPSDRASLGLAVGSLEPEYTLLALVLYRIFPIVKIVEGSSTLNQSSKPDYKNQWTQQISWADDG